MLLNIANIKLKLILKDCNVQNKVCKVSKKRLLGVSNINSKFLCFHFILCHGPTIIYVDHSGIIQLCHRTSSVKIINKILFACLHLCCCGQLDPIHTWL